MSYLPPDDLDSLGSTRIPRIEYQSVAARQWSEAIHDFLLSRRARLGFGIVATIAAILICTFTYLGVRRLADVVHKEDLLDQAWHEVELEHFGRAAQLYETALTEKIDAGDLPYAYGNRGWCYMNLGRDDDALRGFTTALKLDSTPAFAFLDRGIIYHRHGKFAQALADYTAAIALDPNRVDAYRDRAFILAHNGKLKEAIADLNEAIRCSPRDGECYVRRGQLYALENDLDSALASFQSAIHLDPEDGQAFWEQAAVFTRKGQPERGIAALDEAIRQRPKSARLYCARGVVYGDQQIIDKARSDLDQAIRLDPKFPLAYSNRGNVELLSGHWSAALGYAARALSLDPQLTAAHYISGRAYLREGDYDFAISEFDETIRLDSEHVWAVVLRAVCECYEGNCALAERDLQDAVTNFPGAFQAHTIRAWFLATCMSAKFRNGPLALHEAHIAMDLSCNDPDVLDTLAVSYAEAGDFDNAIQLESEALDYISKVNVRRTAVEKRLRLFQQRKPYRDDPG